MGAHRVQEHNPATRKPLTPERTAQALCGLGDLSSGRRGNVAYTHAD
jgi:hypothetical protein